MNGSLQKNLGVLFSLFLFSIAVYGQEPILDYWHYNTTGLTGSYWQNIGNNNNPSFVFNTMTDSADILEVCYTSTDVYIRTEGITANMGQFTNPGVPTAQGETIILPRYPTQELGPRQAVNNVSSIGLLINGVAIFGKGDASSWDNMTQSNIMAGGQGLWNGDAWYGEGMSLDTALGAHPQQQGVYHTHATPFRLYDDNSLHSGIVGFAFDGYPVYGPFGYDDPMDSTSAIVRIESSYQLRNISVREVLPDGTVLASNEYGPDVTPMHPLGEFVEDYEYISGLGHLDEFNGRFCYTPEYPNGTYAYFTATDPAGAPTFPYYLGLEYYGEAYTNRGAPPQIPANAICITAPTTPPTPPGDTTAVIADGASIVPTELMYNPPGNMNNREFLELYNIGDSAINLNGASMIGVNFTFPDTVLEPQSFIILCFSGMAFNNVYGITGPPPFQYTGDLHDNSEEIGLVTAGGDTLFNFTYSDGAAAGWPSEPDNGGNSLVICNPTADLADPSNWAASRTFVGVFNDSIFASPNMIECVAGCGKDVFEPNEDAASAAVLPLIGVNMNAKICDAADEDWFELTVGDKPNFALSLSGLSANLSLELYESSNTSTPVAASLSDYLAREDIIENGAMSGDVYYVRVYSADGSSSNGGYNLHVTFSDQFITSFDRDLPTDGLTVESIGETATLAVNQEVVVYPNPTESVLNVQFYAEDAHAARIVLRNAYGQAIQIRNLQTRPGQNLGRMDVAQLPTGIYFLEVQNGTLQSTHKVMIR